LNQKEDKKKNDLSSSTISSTTTTSNTEISTSKNPVLIVGLDSAGSLRTLTANTKPIRPIEEETTTT